MAKKHKKADALQSAFLEAYKINWNISEAVAKIGTHRQSYYNWMMNDPVFKKTMDEIHETRRMILEDNAERIINDHLNTQGLHSDPYLALKVLQARSPKWAKEQVDANIIIPEITVSFNDAVPPETKK